MSVESENFALSSEQNVLISGLETPTFNLLETSLTSPDHVGSSLPKLVPLAEEIPTFSPFVLAGDVDGDEDVDKADVDLAGQTRRDPLTGENDPRDFNKDGRISGADLVLLFRYIRENDDQLAPVIEAGLFNDTGLDSDSITSDPTITGTVTDTSRVTRLRAGLNSTSLDEFTNIRGLLNDEGTFLITPDQLETINNNNPLTEGEHTLNLYAKDEWGNESFSQVTFTLISSGDGELNLSVMPGQRLEIALSEVFTDVVEASFLLSSDEALPTGRIEENKTLVFYPNLEEIGTYQFTVMAIEGDSQTTQDFRLEVIADPITTTRISGVIQNTEQQPLEGVLIELGSLQTYTDAKGQFILESVGELPSDTLLIRGETVTGNLSYPYVAEKLPLLLEREPITGVNNVIARPIYLPPIDTANAVTIDPNIDVTVTTNNIPGASVFVAAGSLDDQQGQPYTGQLSITEVPRELTPAALPSNLMPDLVVTIQPGEMVFTTPAPLSLPNLAGYDPGTEMDLWSINPVTGLFDNVGTGRVSDDGTVIETISGGIRNSSWHFFTPPPVPADDASENDRNEKDGCNSCKTPVPGTSEVQLHSGAVIESHNLVSYQSLGVNRGLTLTYDSQRADPRPILNFSYSNVSGSANRRLMAELTVQQGVFSYDVGGGEHYWSIPSGGGKIDAALQGDLRGLASGHYDYQLTTGLLQLNNTRLSGSTSSQTGKMLHVNGIGSIFGHGWGLSGLWEIVENADGSVLMINGDGSELLFEGLADGSYDSPPGDFSVLEKLSDGTFQRTLKNQTVYTFNEQNQLAQMEDRKGNTTQYLYNDLGNLIKIIDPVGLETIFSYTEGKVTKITDPANRETLLEYDLAGNLIKITDPDGTSRTWDYDSDFHIISEIDQRGNTEQTFYDEAGRADSAIRKDGSTLDFDPVQVQGLSQGNLTSNPVTAPSAFQLGAVESVYVDANGNTKTTQLDQGGQLVSSFDEVGVLPSVERNEENLVTQIRDARGYLTTYTYDEQGNLLTQQDSLSFGGQFIDISQTGTPFSEINERDDRSAFVSLPFTFEFYGQSYTQIAVSSNGLLSFGGTNNRWQNQSLDSNPVGLLGLPSILPFWDDLETRSDEGANASVYTQVLGEEGSRQFVIQWQEMEAYSFGDETGEITFQVILTEGTNGIQFNYLDVEFEGETDIIHGKGASATIGIWNSNNEFQQYSYNEATLRNGLSLIVSESGIIEASGSGSGTGGRYYTYDPIFNQLTSMVDELGRQTLYEIDPNNGNVLGITQVIGEVGGSDDLITQFTYTNLGLVDLMTDPLGRVTDYDYDGLGRLISTTYAVGTLDKATQKFEYDTAGNLTAFIDENGNRTEWEYDALNRLIKVIEADPDGEGNLTSPITSYTYDKAGNLLSFTDALGQVTTNEYDALNRRVKTTDGNGDITTYGYDSIGNLLSVTDANNYQTNYTYDERNRLVEILDPEGYLTQYSYDLDNNLTAIIDPNGHQNQYVYDARSRLIREIDPLENTTFYQYNAVDNLIATEDQLGRRITFNYDEINRLTQLTNPLDGVISYAYDKVNNLLSVTDELNRTTQYVYDARNRLIQVINPLDGVMTYAYDGVGNLLSLSDELNRTTNYSYDALNRLTRITNPLGNATTYTYDAIDNLTAITDQLGRTTQYSYDALSRLTGITNALGDSISNIYDGVGNLTAITDELGRTTQYTYDGRNLPTAVIDPLQQTTTFEYDGVGNLLSVTDELEQITRYTYDELDRSSTVIDANGQITAFFYDAVGNLLSVEDPEGNLTSYRYDDLDRLIQETNQLGNSRFYEYDAVSNLIGQTDANGRVITFTYDALDRQTAEIWLDESNNPLRTFNYTYDAVSQLLAVSDPDSAYSYTYDVGGRLIEVDNTGTVGVPSVVLNYTYDGVNNRLSVSDTINGQAKGIESFTYDALNRVTQITQSGNGVTDKRVDFSYDAASQMTGVSRYGDLEGTDLVAESTYTYDVGGRLTQLIHGKNTNVLAQYGLVYDKSNRLIQFTSPDGTRDYDYDERGQLLGTEVDNQQTESYSYDGNGNRTNSGYVTGENNQLLSDGIYNYEYDKEGNRTKRTEIATSEVITYQWDYRNRLVKVEKVNAEGTIIESVEYIYDVFDRRIGKIVDKDGEGTETAIIERFVYDGAEIALTFDGEGNLQERFLHGVEIDQVIAQENANGEVFWGLGDHQGSIRDVIDGEGEIINHVTFDSFGQVTGKTDETVEFRFGYTGRELDEETGLYYYRARYYDPATGRFVSEDPIGFSGGDENLYRYVGNSPTIFIDPEGKFALALAPVAVGAIAVLAVALYLANQNLQTTISLPDDEFSPNTPPFPDYDQLESPNIEQLIPPNVETGTPPFPPRDFERDPSALNTAPNSCPLPDDFYKPYLETNPYTNQTDNQLRKSQKRYQDLIQEHQQKIQDYRANPDTSDNQEILKNAPPELREKIIEGRINALQKQINKQQGELSKINQELNNRGLQP